jgi:hypothetical protein
LVRLRRAGERVWSTGRLDPRRRLRLPRHLRRYPRGDSICSAAQAAHLDRRLRAQATCDALARDENASTSTRSGAAHPREAARHRTVSWHVRFAGRAVLASVRFGSRPTSATIARCNRVLAGVRRQP